MPQVDCNLLQPPGFRKPSTPLTLLILLSIVATCLGQDASAQLPKLNIVLFVPSDIDPPADAHRRFLQIAAYAENFLVSEMTKDGYPPAVTKPFPRDENDNYQFLFVRGEHPVASGKYDKPDFRGEVINKAVEKYKLSKDNHVWWIWIYLGDPPKRFSDYRGGGSARYGGWAMLNYTNIPGVIDLSQPLAADFHHDLTLKACIHELGHAFGLPHWGPVKRDRRGNSLMGPQTKVYRNRVDEGEKEVYLLHPCAAMLWKHPIFSGTAKDRDKTPKFHVEDFQGEANTRGRYLDITGRLVSDIPAHSAIVFEDVPDGSNPYFRKSFVGKVDEKGNFSVRVHELDHAEGKLRVLFCFENGLVTGDGKGHGDRHALTTEFKADRRGAKLTSGLK